MWHAFLFVQAKVDAVTAAAESARTHGKALEAASIGELDASRAQLLWRYTQGATALAALHGHYVDNRLALSPANLQQFLKFQTEADAFLEWYKAQNSFEAMADGWTFDPHVCKVACRVLQNSSTKVLKDWNSTLMDCEKELKSLIPAKSLLENPLLVADTDKRKALANMASKLSKHPCLKQAAEYQNVLKTTIQAMSSSQRSLLPAYGTLCEQRQLAKLTIGVNWAVDQVVSVKPGTMVDIVKHANHIRSSLKAKGLAASAGCAPLPSFLDKILEKMSKAA